jgi:two-component system, cell cycle response regulator DivK
MDLTSGCVVLVVDDDPETRSMYAEYLHLSGVEVAQARNGHEALDLYDTVPPDLVVTDIQMPRMGGIQLIRSLRARSQTRQLPVICLSAGIDCVREAAAVGCAAAIQKPCPPDTLVALIRRILHDSGGARGGATHARRDPVASGTTEDGPGERQGHTAASPRPRLSG